MAELLAFRTTFATLPGITGRRGRGSIVFFGEAAGDATLPVITDMSPADGESIFFDTALSFNVTDPGSNLSRATILAYFPASGNFEVVYFGTTFTAGVHTFTAGFASGYTGTRTVIADGYQFSNVVRTAGWPSSPVLVVDAGDDAGNESA